MSSVTPSVSTSRQRHTSALLILQGLGGYLPEMFSANVAACTFGLGPNCKVVSPHTPGVFTPLAPGTWVAPMIGNSNPLYIGSSWFGLNSLPWNAANNKGHE